MAYDKALGSAIAGGAIAVALVETLFDKGILTLDEGRDILDRALRTAGAYAQSDGGWEAGHIIGALQRGKFSARRSEP
jgi:hypothetical protein